MKEFNYNIFLGEDEVANTTICAKTKDEADIIIRQQYPTSKGFKCVLTNDK